MCIGGRNKRQIHAVIQSVNITQAVNSGDLNKTTLSRFCSLSPNYIDEWRENCLIDEQSHFYM